jgi:hypothetical protein
MRLWVETLLEQSEIYVDIVALKICGKKNSGLEQWAANSSGTLRLINTGV